MYRMLKQQVATWQKHFYLACGLYGVSWLSGILVTLTWAPQQVMQQMLIAPEQTHDAWYYIGHNIGVEGILLLGACTFGIGTGLILCMNGLLDGILATAIAQHYGPSILLAGLLPHGLFETGAWILISTCGFLLSGHFKRIISSLWHNNSRVTSEYTNTPVEMLPEAKKMSTISNIKDVYFALIISSTLLLVLAGTIEACISPMLVRLLISSIKG